MRRLIVFLASHGLVFAAGFALGIYLLPILTAPENPDSTMLEARSQDARFEAAFTRDLAGSDFLHWGEGRVSLTDDQIIHMGALAPGPDYKLYLTTAFVEDEAGFEALKSNAALIGEVKTFGGFLLDIPQGVDISAYNTVVVWCESFGEFITSAQYQ